MKQLLKMETHHPSYPNFDVFIPSDLYKLIKGYLDVLRRKHAGQALLVHQAYKEKEGDAT
jgi:hypothetical protein